MNNIRTELSKWVKDRRMDIDDQRVGIVPNLMEEVTEYYRATSETEKVDAICDIIVFSLNCIGEDFKLTTSEEKETGSLFPADTMSDEYKKLELAVLMGSIIKDISEVSLNMTATKRYDSGLLCSTLDKIIIRARKMLRVLGYNDLECLRETLKEISSRVGYYDDNIGKFVKDKSPEAQANWYSADYTKCVIHK